MPAPSTPGSTSPASTHAAREVREELLAPLRRVLAWMVRHADARGRIVCPEHQVEHTGKNVGLIVLCCELLARDRARDPRLLELAVAQARRACEQLQREGTSECHTFRPGRHDPFNGSNAVIDGGAAADALGQLVRDFGPELAAADRDRFRAAALLHARTYLRYAVLDKGVPAQRAWGLTGLAQAWALENDPELERAALAACADLAHVQHADGSWPYHPRSWGGPHAGAGDVSSFYQSRIPAFLVHALALLGRDPRAEPHASSIRRGIEFALALQGPDGVKCGLVEAKPWYWGAEYEVASHPFDVHAFASAWRLWRDPRHAIAARRAFEAFVRHLGDDGAPQSHLPGPGREKSYQCPLFWAGHTMWIARALGDLHASWDLPAPPAPRPGALDLALRWFPDAQLGRLEDGCAIAWVRGARPGSSLDHGSPIGAGLVRVFGRREQRDLLERARGAGALAGEWSGARGAGSLARGWRGGAHELRFSLWRARVAWRRRDRLDALATPLRASRRGLLAFASPSVSSAWDLAPAVECGDASITLRSRLAHRGGDALEASRLVRSFEVDGEGLLVSEELEATGGARGLEYRVPSAARVLQRSERRLAWRLG